MNDESIAATNGPYCGEDCPAWGMWDLDQAWCDVFEKKLSIKQDVGTHRCLECLQFMTQETWYPKFSAWRGALRKQDKEDKDSGKDTSKYLRKEYRES